MITILNILIVGNIIVFGVLLYRISEIVKIEKKITETGYINCCRDILKVIYDSVQGKVYDKTAIKADVLQDILDFLENKILKKITKG